MDERKKLYKRICNRKIAIPGIILLIVFLAVSMSMQPGPFGSLTKFLPIYGVLCLIANAAGMKKDKKRLEDLGGISDEDAREIEDRLKRFRKRVVAVLAVILALVIAVGMWVINFSGPNDYQRGDGVNTCRNCGRSTSLVAGFGFCGDCYEGFTDWQKND